MNYICKLMIVSGVLMFVPGSLFSQHAPFKINCTVFNVTTGRPQKPDFASLVVMKNVAEVIQEMKPQGPSFSFSELRDTSFPVLIRVVYKDVVYSEMLDLNHLKAGTSQKIPVYENGASPDDIAVTSMIQLLKKKDSIHVTEIFSINNKSNPPRVYSQQNLYLKIPDNAASLKINLQHEKAGVSLPVNHEPFQDRLHLLQNIKPGISGLSAEYDIPGTALTSGTLYLGDDSGKPMKPESQFKIAIWQPANAVPEIQGGQVSSVTIPDLGEALRINFIPGHPLTYSMNKGDFLSESSENEWRNPLFDSFHKSIIGILLFTAILLFVLYYSLRSESAFKK